MNNKNLIIILLGVVLISTIGFFLYSSHKQQQLYQQTLQRMEYNMNRSGSGDGKGQKSDPYKEVAVNNALRKKVREIQECYNSFVKANPQKTDGFVEIDWIILPDGKVKKAELISSDLNSEALNSCILGIVRSIEFVPPPTGSETYITYKYHFKKVEDEKSEPTKVK